MYRQLRAGDLTQKQIAHLINNDEFRGRHLTDAQRTERGTKAFRDYLSANLNSVAAMSDDLLHRTFLTPGAWHGLQEALNSEGVSSIHTPQMEQLRKVVAAEMSKSAAGVAGATVATIEGNLIMSPDAKNQLKLLGVRVVQTPAKK